MDYLNNFKKYRYLLYELVKKDIKLKYRRSYLGILWTLMEPILTTLVLNFVFGTIFSNNKQKHFIIYILIGRLLYSCFSTATKTAMRSIRANQGMIKKVYVPKYIYPMASVLSNFVIFLISLIVLVIFCVIERVGFSVYSFQAIIPIITLFILCIGTGMLLATIAVYFRDMEYLWEVMTMLIMYCSAIFYPVSRLGTKGDLLKFNPLYTIIANFRTAVIDGKMIDWWFAGYGLIFSVVILAVGVYVFKKKQDNFILHI